MGLTDKQLDHSPSLVSLETPGRKALWMSPYYIYVLNMVTLRHFVEHARVSWPVDHLKLAGGSG